MLATTTRPKAMFPLAQQQLSQDRGGDRTEICPFQTYFYQQKHLATGVRADLELLPVIFKK
jgi:hypothetical protein